MKESHNGLREAVSNRLQEAREEVVRQINLDYFERDLNLRLVEVVDKTIGVLDEFGLIRHDMASSGDMVDGSQHPKDSHPDRT